MYPALAGLSLKRRRTNVSSAKPYGVLPFLFVYKHHSVGFVCFAWVDPDFDPKLESFYYVRILEIPTPRWVLYDRVRLGAEIPKEAKLIQQERAYSSPIWYTP